MSGRPVLSLRLGAAPAKPATVWLCKPCGSKVDIAEGLADEAVIRCGHCNAKLGVYRDFANPTPTFARLRARPAPEKPKPAPRPAGVVVERKVKKTVWTK